MNETDTFDGGRHGGVRPVYRLEELDARLRESGRGTRDNREYPDDPHRVFRTARPRVYGSLMPLRRAGSCHACGERLNKGQYGLYVSRTQLIGEIDASYVFHPEHIPEVFEEHVPMWQRLQPGEYGKWKNGKWKKQCEAGRQRYIDRLDEYLTRTGFFARLDAEHAQAEERRRRERDAGVELRDIFAPRLVCAHESCNRVMPLGPMANKERRQAAEAWGTAVCDDHYDPAIHELIAHEDGWIRVRVRDAG